METRVHLPRAGVHERAVAQFGSASALGAGCRRFKSCQPDNESNVLRNRIDCGGHLVIYAIASVLNDGADNAGDDGHNQRSDYGPPESIDGYSHVEQAYGQPRRKLHEQPVDD